MGGGAPWGGRRAARPLVLHSIWKIPEKEKGTKYGKVKQIIKIFLMEKDLQYKTKSVIITEIHTKPDCEEGSLKATSFGTGLHWPGRTSVRCRRGSDFRSKKVIFIWLRKWRSLLFFRDIAGVSTMIRPR